jgi:Putative collagen-binding domain of a collagenase
VEAASSLAAPSRTWQSFRFCFSFLEQEMEPSGASAKRSILRARKTKTAPFVRAGLHRLIERWEIGFMCRLFELRPWYKLVPDQSVIAAGQGENEDHVRAARAEGGSFVIAYLPSGKPVSIKMNKVSGKTVKAQWYDPRKGTWLPIGEYANTGVREFTAPSRGEKDDWVLVLEDAAKGYRTARTAFRPDRTATRVPIPRSTIVCVALVTLENALRCVGRVSDRSAQRFVTLDSGTSGGRVHASHARQVAAGNVARLNDQGH